MSYEIVGAVILGMFIHATILALLEMKGIHIAEMLVAVQPIKREARKEGLFSRLNPF